MSKGLEALERIKEFMKLNAKHWKQDVGYIEKELKRLEELDNGAYVSIHINRYIELCGKEDAFDALSKENEKVFKELPKEIEKNIAFEIIKKKLVNLFHVAHTETQEAYNDLVNEHYRELTKEEYELLKEVLNGD